MSQHEQQRQAKGVPYISHLFAVSGLVWEDGGDEEQAIAALLHDAIVADCTDTNGSVAAGGKKEPWLLPKTRSIEHLQNAPLDSLLASAVDKAQNACDMVLDARRQPTMWIRFNAGLEGSAWSLLRLHQTLCHRLKGSRSVELLGESVQEILSSDAYRACVPEGITAGVWAAGYGERLQLAEQQQLRVPHPAGE